VLAEGEGAGVSHLAAAGGPQRFQSALATSLAAARQQLPLAWRHLPLAHFFTIQCNFHTNKCKNMITMKVIVW
jgi:hypothetical protein